MRLLAACLVLAAAAGCASPSRTESPAPFAPAPGSASQAPYDAAPAGNSRIDISIDMRAAREILALLSEASFSSAAAKQLETLPAVELAIADSSRPPETFERDLAAAFDDQARVAIFDFRRIREGRSRWQDLLGLISSREAELTRMSSERARALIPPDRTISVTLPFYLTFGLASRADHIALPGAGGAEWGVVIDLSRALADTEASSPAEQIKQLARLMAAEAYQRAWAQYRADSPAWQKHDSALGQLEPLVRIVAEAGPVALYNVDENFFPLSVWLKGPMKTSIDELNRVADQLVSTEGELDQRMAIAGEIKKPEFVSGIAGPAGAFLADGIIQTHGIDAYRTALSQGPSAFFEAYDKAADQQGKALIPLSKAIQDRLAGLSQSAPQP
jgi:hypothetical protein